MTSQEKTRWHRSYTEAEIEDERLREELRRTESKAQKITSWASPIPASGGIDKIQQCVEKLSLLQEELLQAIDRSIAVREEVCGVINAVSYMEYRILLRYRYIEGMGFEEIAGKMHYSWRHTVRLHGYAVANCVMECHIKK